VFLFLTTVAVPGYYARLDTIRGVKGLFSDEAEVQPDGPTRGRVTEMLAALKVFLDHPILGVGPGQYTPFYSKEYQLDPDIAFRYLPKTRRAHTLYFEMAAETGFLGITTFMAIVLLVMTRLWHMRRRWLYIRPDLAHLATAFLLSLVAYLGTAVFLHFSFQRYYWLLLAVAGAALQVLRSEIMSADRQEEAVLANPDAWHDVALRSF
jgi:O-antigen ligase